MQGLAHRVSRDNVSLAAVTLFANLGLTLGLVHDFFSGISGLEAYGIRLRDPRGNFR